MGYSYNNTNGTGDRTGGGGITVTTTATLGAGTIAKLVDGSTTANSTHATWFNNGQSGVEIKFDFGTGRVVRQARWYQDTGAPGVSTHGTWKWRGSNDDSSYTDIGSAFTLGGVGGAQIHTELINNTTSYRYYKLVQQTGTTNSGPWLEEIEFFIDGATDEEGDTSYAYPLGGSSGAGASAVSGGNGVDRSSHITITVNHAAGGGEPTSNLVDGATANNSTDSWEFPVAGQTDQSFKFHFDVAQRITAITWEQNTNTAQGTYTLSGSNDDSSYTTIQTGIVLVNGLSFNETTFTNVNSYLYYKLVQTAGTTSNSPWVHEIYFKLVPTTITLGVTGTWGSTEAKDTFAGTGGVLSGTWGSTEAKDTFASAGYPQLKGTLGATETKDTFAGTGTAPNPAPVFVNAGTRTHTNFATSITPTLPASLVNGNFLLAIVTLGSDKTPISTPTGWTVFNAFNNNLIGTVYYRFVDGTETDPTFNFGGGSTSATAKIWQFKNVITLGANNITPDAGNLNTFSNTGLTTTSHNALVICLWYGNNGTVTGTPTGYTSRTNESNLALFDQTFAALGSASTAIVNQPLSTLMNSMSFEIELCSELPPAFATMGPTEAKDVWASYGSLIGGSWHSTELRDLFSAAGYPQMIGSWGSTEAKDVWAGTGTIPPFGTWASIEAKDTFAGTGTAAAPLSVDVHATGSSHDSTSASVSLTTTHADEVIVLAIYSGGHWDRAKVGSITDTAGLTWKKRNQRWSQGDNPSMEIWWAKKATSGATTITVHTLSEAGDPVGATQTGNKTGFLCVEALAIAGANTDKPFDTHTGAGWFTDNFGNMRFGAPGDNGTVARYYSNATKGMALAFYNTIGRPSSGAATSGTGWTWLERVSVGETNGNTGVLETAYKILNGRLLGDFFQLTEDTGALGGHGIMQDVIVAAADPNVATVSTNDVIRFFFDGPGQQTIVQLSGSNKSQSLALSTFNPDTVIVVAVMVQSAFGARVDHVADDGGGSGWTRRGIEVGVPGSLSLETWWCHHATPFTGNITVTLDSTAQAGDILGFVAVGIHGADVFQRGEIWDGHESLPKVNKDAGMASYQTTGNFSSLNADVLELNFAANTGSGFSDGGLENFNEDPWLQFHGDFFGSLTGLLNSAAPNFNIAIQFKFSAGVVINDHTELNVTPSPTKWLMITDVMPVGPAIPPTGAWGSVEAKDRFTHSGDFTAIGIASPGGWVGFPPNSAVLDATDQKDRATNNGAYTAIWDTNGWIGYVPASMTLAFTENKDVWVSHAWVLGPTTILARWESVERKDGFGFTSAYTWYTTPDSKGDRTSRITVTSNALVGGSSGPFDRLVNGLRANNAASAIWVTPSQIAPMYFRFDFGTPRVVNEALWFQNGPSAQPGLWKWQGSNDSTTWTDLSATFVFNGNNSGSPVLGDFSSNQTPYRFYQVIQTTLAGGNDLPWLWEIEFKVGGFSGSMGAAESKDRMNYQMQLIPKVDPIPARKHRLLIVS